VQQPAVVQGSLTGCQRDIHGFAIVDRRVRFLTAGKNVFFRKGVVVRQQLTEV